MKQYPYIGKVANSFGECSVALLCSNNLGALLKNDIDNEQAHVFRGDFNGTSFTNITHEYLQNTYGVVESKEHAEFIVELATDFRARTGFSEHYPCWFCFDEDEIFFFEDPANASDEGEKQITIPLPPKAESKPYVSSTLNYSNYQVKSSAPELSEAGHNLVFAASECKGWPCVGDEVSCNKGVSKGVVIGIHDDAAWIKKLNGKMDIALISQLQKPKTPEEALRDDIKQEIFSHFAIFPELLDKRDTVINISECVSNALLTKYSITPKEV